MHASLCRPCQVDGDRGEAGDLSATCLEHTNGLGLYCGAHCDAMSPCPVGYECTESALEDGTFASQCVPMSGAACARNALSSDEGASTSCSLTSEHGSCSGARACGEAGLSECTALTPSAEVCDAMDNNCDGEIDEDLGVITCGQGLCETTVNACIEGEVPSCEPATQPGEVTEACNDIDDDCDGEIDEELRSLSCEVGLCKTSVPACLQGAPNACEPLFQPGEIAEACNDIDDDCDGEIDEGLSDCA
jgi:hypothetical protein